ncbi:hypothetical protein BN1200_530090 [Klebsiella variicola]|nr:hypothetical protein BN1200_530090 [Klebsiella variicola]
MFVSRRLNHSKGDALWTNTRQKDMILHSYAFSAKRCIMTALQTWKRATMAGSTTRLRLSIFS